MLQAIVSWVIISSDTLIRGDICCGGGLPTMTRAFGDTIRPLMKGRRSILRAAAAGLAVPLAAAASPRPGRIDLPRDLPICRAAIDAVPTSGTLRKLKVSLNTNAGFSSAGPVAQERGFFDAVPTSGTLRKLKVSLNTNAVCSSGVPV